MSSEEQFDSEPHNLDEQLATEQEKVHEERETSFSFRKEVRDAGPSTPTRVVEREDAIAPTTQAPANEEEDEEAAAVEEAIGVEPVAPADTDEAAEGSKARSSRKSLASKSAEHDDQARKRPRKSTTPSEKLPDTDANVRLDRLRQALFRFLDLIEHRATRSSFEKALPHIDTESVEALRQQFVTQLKEAIIDESEKLIESNDLESKLASLHQLTQEADARYQSGYQEGADEIKDVWRKEMDLETAISAKAIPDQERRVQELKQELETVRSQNIEIHRQLIQTRGRSDAIQNDARDSLDALQSAIKGLEATPDMQNKLRQTMDDLLQDLGARV